MAQAEMLLWLLFRVEVRGKHESMFDVVDAKFGGLAVRDRAEMPRHFEAALVRCINHSPELACIDVHERLIKKSRPDQPRIQLSCERAQDR